MSTVPMLSLVTLAPLAAAVAVASVPQSRPRLARGIALGSTLLSLTCVLSLAWGFDLARGDYQFVERHPWVSSLGVYYHLGMDGLGWAMLLLTAVLVPFALLAGGIMRDRPQVFDALVLALQAGLFGSFTALNFFHWFLFWELSLLPAFFLVRLWGGPGRAQAAMQFFVYTMVGSVALLLAFLGLRLATGSFEFDVLASLGRAGGLADALGREFGGRSWSGQEVASAFFLMVLLGFAVKVPLMPFHTWLPAVYAEAPSAVTMLLTGAMSKMGMYGLLRIVWPIFPEQLRSWSVLLLGLALVTVVAGAAAALVQRDLKRVLAYSSINHLGYCQLALFAVAVPAGSGSVAHQAAALDGAILQMFNHGLTAAALFAGVAFLERRSGGARDLDGFGGLRQVAPIYAGLMGIALFASAGLPGLGGFVGEFLIFRGVLGLVPWAAVAAVPGLLFTAWFTLQVIQRMFWGPVGARAQGLPDLDWRERAVLAPALILVLVLGVWPQALVGWINPTVLAWLERGSP